MKSIPLVKAGRFHGDMSGWTRVQVFISTDLTAGAVMAETGRKGALDLFTFLFKVAARWPADSLRTPAHSHLLNAAGVFGCFRVPICSSDLHGSLVLAR